MKTYKLIGLEKYVVAFNESDAKITFWLNKIGVLETNIEEVNAVGNRDALGKVFNSLSDLESYEVEY